MKREPTVREMVTIPGLTEADAAEAAVARRLATLRLRRDDAKRTREAAERRRSELVAATTAGEDVAPDEVASVAATIQAAQAQEAVLAEALPGVEAQLAEAETAVWAVLREEQGRRQAAADEEVARAEEGVSAALLRRSAAKEERAAWDRLRQVPRTLLEQVLRDPGPLHKPVPAHELYRGPVAVTISRSVA